MFAKSLLALVPVGTVVLFLIGWAAPTAALFDRLGALDDWADRAVFGDRDGADALVRDLAAHALIEVRA